MTTATRNEADEALDRLRRWQGTIHPDYQEQYESLLNAWRRAERYAAWHRAEAVLDNYGWTASAVIWHDVRRAILGEEPAA
jgi:hypothetical protein